MVNEWAWLTSRVCLLRLEVQLASVLESALDRNGDTCVKGMYRLKLISSENNSGFKGSKLHLGV